MLNKLHKEFGYIAILVSIIVYIVIFQSVYNFGEAGRIKVGILAALLFSIPSIIFLVIQLYLLKKILKDDKICVKNLILFLIFYFFFIGLFIDTKPFEIYIANSICLFVGIIGFYTSAYYNKRILFWLFILFSIINVLLTIWMCERTNQDNEWFKNGKEIKYNEFGVKTYEAEHKKGSIVFGKEMQWNDAGIPTSFKHYPKGNRYYRPDSAVFYNDYGKIKEQRYLFDSVGRCYQRSMKYSSFLLTKDGKYMDEERLELNELSIVDTLDNSFFTKEWDRRKYGRYLNLEQYTFDSNGVDYERVIRYNENGIIIKVNNQKFNHERKADLEDLFGY